MENWEQTLGTGPLLGLAAGAIALILALVVIFKVHAFVALLVVSAVTAIAARIPIDQVMPTLLSGFGGTLGTVALLVGLGAMIGRLAERSGGAQSLADAMIKKFGEDKAPLALSVASLIMGFPIFFDAGLIVMLPVIFAVARRLSGNILAYALPAVGAFAAMHAMVPPHPGPVAASEFFGADVGLVLLVGLIVAIPAWYVSGYLMGKWAGKKYPLPVPDILIGEELAPEDAPKSPATAIEVIFVLLLPMLLIFGNTGLSTLATAGHIDGDSMLVKTFVFLGQTPIALLITTIVAMAVFGARHGMTKEGVEKLMEGALGPICSVVLITGAGGMFGGVLRTSGIGDALAGSMESLGLTPFFAAYLVAIALRVAQGSATVALTTAAALMAPAVEAANYGSLQLALIVVATGSGAVMFSHVNDSGFWLVGRLLGMDLKTTFKTWTLMETIIGFLGFLFTGAAFLITTLI